MKKIFRKEKGQSLVVFALLFVIMVGFAGIVVDYGYPAFISQKMQNACDAAALAAAQDLPAENSEKDNVRAVAKDYAKENGFENDEVTVEVKAGSTGANTIVTVTISRYVPFTIGKMFGSDGATITKTATVELIPLTGIKGVVPLSVEKSVFDSQISSGNFFMTLKYGGGGGQNGSYGALDIDGSIAGGANDYRERMKTGYDEIVSVGDVVPAEKGNMSGPTAEGVAYRYGKCTHFGYPDNGEGCTPEHYDVNCPRLMFVPVIQYVDSNQKYAEIKGFAPFLLDGHVGSGNDSIVYGTYLPEVKTTGETDPSKPFNPYGTYTVKLTN